MKSGLLRRMIRKLVFVLVMSSLALPLFAGEADVLAQQLRAGEAVNGFPNWSERVIHEWMNRARVDPRAELAGCTACADRACYSAMPPLYWDLLLNRSARYHADEQSKQGYFGHDSHCTIVPNIDALYPAGCDGSASCGCVGGMSSCAAGGCTSWAQRIGLFGGGASGEIIATSVDPEQSFYLWLYEPESAPACGFTGMHGHRYLILESSGAVGVGVSGQSVGDFGGSVTSYRIVSGSHYPQQAPTVQAWANWYDTNAPRSAAAVVDGRCVGMSLKRGTPQNGAWSATVTGVGSGCHRYYFSFIDSSGFEVTYPATGSLGIGSDAACADWDATRLHATCTSTPPPPSRHRSSKH
jgi:hypothetical protein